MRCFAAVCLSLMLVAGVVSADDEVPLPARDPALVPAAIVRVPQSVKSVLLASAEDAALTHFSIEDGRPRAAASYYLSVGTNGVGKERAWDRKTPLGVYFITEEIDTAGLDPKYGPLAFALDYPNAWDRRHERTGYGIWLHGVHPETPLRPRRDTDGCLALPNASIVVLAPHLEAYETPVLVAERALWTTPQRVASVRRELDAALSDWVSTLASADLYGHLAMYAEDFAADGLDRSALAELRLERFSSTVAGARIDDVLILGVPSEAGLYLTRFDLEVGARGHGTTYRKRLYWQRRDGRWLVVSEDAG